MNRNTLARFAWLSIAAAVIAILLKGAAFFLTGSVGLLSDALETSINLVSALVVLVVLRIASRPPDADHAYGYSKIEYFSSGIEGTLILLAALGMACAGVERILHPQPVAQIGPGLAISSAASIINLAVGQILLRAGRHFRSITLEADGHHLISDVWTSIGVVAGVAAVGLTHWQVLDSLVALAVAGGISLTGIKLLRRSMLGLLDSVLPNEDVAVVRQILDGYGRLGIQFHALRTRQSGMRRFVSFHVLVPDSWTVQHGHRVVERIEDAIRTALPQTTVFTHLEPMYDQTSFEDIDLDRTEPQALISVPSVRRIREVISELAPRSGSAGR